MKGTKTRPAVSVIIPTHNYARFLVDAAESVLSQTFDDLELIIVDDGSTDNTADVVKQFLKDQRVRYIYQDNKGPSAARNAGIRKAKGELIALLDADDIWLPSKLRKQVKVIGESEDVGLVYCLAEHVDEKGDALTHMPMPHMEQPTFRDLLYFPLTLPSCVLIRKHVLDEVGLFDETISHNEDADMWIRILRYYKSAYVNEMLVRIRKHPGSRMTDLESMERNLLVHVKKCIERFPELEGDRQEAYFQIYKGLTYLAYMFGKKRKILRYYLKAALIRPSFLFTSPVIFARKYLLRKRQIC